LINDRLNIALYPIKCEKTHAFDGSIILTVSACTVNYMCDLV